MTYKEANQISIKEYLRTLNIHPVKETNYYGMYHSPLRNDQNASMKVDYNKNLWIDYGTNEGGTTTDLVMKINNCSNVEAVKLLEHYVSGSNSFSFHGNSNLYSTKEKQHTPIMQIQKVTDLINPALIQYLSERRINSSIAKQYCKEVHYTVNNKPYYAIGFSNNAGGYELRNNYFKGCTSKDIATINKGNDCCIVFEGFIDYLSYLTLKNGKFPKADVLILNSVSNLSKSLDSLKSHKEVYTFLDNDDAGRYATQLIKSVCTTVHDQAPKYSKYKDINDLLCRKEVPNDCKHESKQSRLHESMTSFNQSVIKNKPGRRTKL